MQKLRSKWQTTRGERAAKLIARIKLQVSRLDDEDLLDLHDIFVRDVGSPLDKIASVEAKKRKLIT
jgi:hypothetical protein